jgi:hypothetical protein
VCALVHIEIFFQLKPFPAIGEVAYPLLLLRMCLFMPFKGTLLYKFFSTLVAPKRPLARVCSNVPSEWPSTWEFYVGIWGMT